MHEEKTLPPSLPPHEDAATLPPSAAPESLGTQVYAPTAAADTTIPAIPGYTITDELGRGGMGVVYRGEQTSLRRAVALKMILAGNFAAPDARRRFLAEAEVIAKLQHPNIVQVHEFGDHAAHPFFSLEYVSGGGLDRKLAEHPLAAVEAARLLVKLARAMDYAHRQGIIHRDLKPANILLTAEGEPKITDFGLAKHGDSQLTASGAIMGTPSYMAPEQAEGKSEQIGPATDVYALGAILYECLTGRPPFRAATPLDTVVQVMTQEPVPPTKLQPQTPVDLETICLKCLRKEPSKRYPTAAALAEELERFLKGEPILARPVSRGEKLVRWCRRNPYLAGAVGVVLLLAVGLLGLLAFFVQHRLQAASDLERENQATLAALKEAEVAEQQARVQKEKAQAAQKHADDEKARAVDQLYANSINLAHREWQANNNLRAAQLLYQCPPDHRGWEWHYLKGLTRGELFNLFGHASITRRVVYSPDGKWIATANLDGTVKLWEAAVGKEVYSWKLTAVDVTFSPDSKHLAVATGKNVAILDVATHVMVQAHRGTGGNLLLVAYTHGGQRLATLDEQGQVCFWDMTTGAFLHKLPKRIPSGGRNNLDVSRACFSPDGRWLATGGNTGILLWELTTGENVWKGTGHFFSVSNLAFSPDSTLLASGGGEGTIKLWDVAARKELRTLKFHDSFVEALTFSADGRRLASGARDRTAKVWDVATGEEEYVLRGHQNDVTAVAFSSDGSRLATASIDQTVKVWDLAPRIFKAPHVADFERQQGLPVFSRQATQETVTLYPHLGPVLEAVFSPDGHYLATSSLGDNAKNHHEQVCVWDLTRRQKVRGFVVPIGRFHTLAFSPDGKYLAVGTGGGDHFITPAEVRVWEVSTGKLVWESLGGLPSRLVRVTFSPQGKVLAASIGGETQSELRYWEMPTGKLLSQVPMPKTFLRGIEFTADGHMVGGELNGQMTVWTWPGGQVKKSFRANAVIGQVVTFATSRQGTLATGHVDGKIRLFDLHTGQPRGELAGHNGLVLEVAWNPDGTRLVSCAQDLTVKIWDPATLQELLTFREHRVAAPSVAWSRDGRRIVSAGSDGPVRIWEANPTAQRVATQDWPVLFADDFNRADVAPHKPTLGSQWHMDNGRLCGTLSMIKDPRTPQFPGTILTLKAPPLPTLCEVRFEAEVSRPLLIGTAFTQGVKNWAVMPFISGTLVPFSVQGVQVFQYREGQMSLIGIPAPFKMEAGRRYRIRILREPRAVTLFVDDVEIFSSEISEFDTPLLQLQGSWGDLGEKVWYDNVEIRAPKELPPVVK